MTEIKLGISDNARLYKCPSCKFKYHPEHNQPYFICSHLHTFCEGCLNHPSKPITTCPICHQPVEDRHRILNKELLVSLPWHKQKKADLEKKPRKKLPDEELAESYLLMY